MSKNYTIVGGDVNNGNGTGAELFFDSKPDGSDKEGDRALLKGHLALCTTPADDEIDGVPRAPNSCFMVTERVPQTSVAYGRCVGGESLVRQIAHTLPDHRNRPQLSVLIVKCGELSGENATVEEIERGFVAAYEGEWWVERFDLIHRRRLPKLARGLVGISVGWWWCEKCGHVRSNDGEWVVWGGEVGLECVGSRLTLSLVARS